MDRYEKPSQKHFAFRVKDLHDVYLDILIAL